MSMTATYSPDDNKLRLYASSRLDKETYDRVKAAGFKWAPKQDLFVAPTWSPGREDLLIELCGEIGDEDTSLIDRAEQRADRFGEYSDKRMADAESARKAVDAIADGIPFGQPILVGHHSERHARKDAERIESGMRKAVKMWKTSQYWTDRAAGAIQHAKYKELPAVRHRRIKTIESEQRKTERSKAESENWLKLWTREGLKINLARKLASACWLTVGKHPTLEGVSLSAYDVLREDSVTPWTVEQVQDVARRVYPRSIAHCDRWLEHFENRLAYERAMLAEQIGTEVSANPLADRFAFAVGGQVQTRRSNEWVTVLKVNRGANGSVSSITTTTAPGSRNKRAHWRVESVNDYQAPTAENVAAAKATAKLPPLCNYPGDGFAHMAQAEYDKVPKDYRGYRAREATATAGAHRTRVAIGAYALKGECDDNKRHSYVPVFITDAKRVDAPQPPAPKEPTEPAEFVAAIVAAPDKRAPTPPVAADLPEASATADFEAMERALKQGIKVVAAPQLFLTPTELARDVVKIAGVMPGERVLEPQAGTGAILRAVFSAFTEASCGRVVAVEINPQLAESLRQDQRRRVGANDSNFAIHCADFLDCTPEDLGTFHRICMNPPFENGIDIKHIEHARAFLKPGGRLVSICADGPRQRARLEPIATEWRELPAGTFKEAGTNVNTALVIIDAPAE